MMRPFKFQLQSKLNRACAPASSWQQRRSNMVVRLRGTHTRQRESQGNASELLLKIMCFKVTTKDYFV
jgi:hypothetical protein